MGSAQVPQDGIRLVQGKVSILKLWELPIQLGGEDNTW